MGSYPLDINNQFICLFIKFTKFLCLMGCGVVMSYGYQKRIRRTKTILLLLILIMVYLAYKKPMVETISYLLSFLIFVFCYWQRKIFTSNIFINYFGNSSYSLYLVHGVQGFIVMYMVLAYDGSTLLAILLAIIYSMIISLLFYRFVDIPLLKFKKLILERF